MNLRAAAIAVAAFAAAIPATQLTLSLLQTAGRPAAAVGLWSTNSLALGRLAGNAAVLDATPAQRAAARDAGVRALMLEPGNAIAARALGVLAGLRGDERTTTAALAYSEAMSRRDLPTQLALIELRVQQGDIPGALRHYDRALRTSRSVPVLLSTMISASSDPTIRREVLNILAQRPPWRSAFLVQLIDEQTPPDTVLAFLQAMRLDPANAYERQMLSRGVGKLAGQGRVAQARGLLPASAGLIRNGGFEGENAFPPIDWALVDEANLNAVAEGGPEGRGQVLYLDARNGRGGEVARQMTALRPGRYRLSFAAGDVTGDGTSRPRIAVTCGEDAARTLSTMVAPVMGAAGRMLRTDVFAVDSTCPVQRVTIALPAPLDGAAPRPWIDDVAVQPTAGD